MTPAFAPAVTAGQMGWVSILIFGFPIAMVLLGEAIRRLQRRLQKAKPFAACNAAAIAFWRRCASCAIG